ncbi:hypothetical protein, conserved [Eimeria maxima]|uniref:Glideosome-associated protein with multiple-membrane spans GAPM3 n=1 Tax=Eimeria maxima TaxID=5804 RepID=U6MCX0_EIMMA|nr:hypothetical protein, conserved [Eimeria maxima]CDJ60918.1 hypothetical protein, conserved [Eimeria maxima]
MWFTTRQEGLDDPRPAMRGPCLDLPTTVFCGGVGGNSFLLRGGFLLQLFSLTGLFISYWASGGAGLFGYELQGMNEAARSSEGLHTALAFFSGLYMLGAAYLVCFQAIAADDACWARGYRSGSKVLRLATFLDLLSSVMQFIFFLYIAKFYKPKWYLQFKEGGPECLFFSYIRCLHAVCLALYGAATYLLEVYHDEGAGDLHAYINSALFGLASLVEFCVLFVPVGGASALTIWLALLAAAIWAVFFEPEVNNVSPALHETELTNDVEQQVEKFARLSPYYPSGDPSGLQQQQQASPSPHASFSQAPSQQFLPQASVVAQAYETEGRQRS